MIHKVRQELYKSLPLMGQGLRLVWNAARFWSIAWGVLLLLQGTIPAAQIYLIRQTVDLLSVTLANHGGLADLTRTWLPITFLGLFWIISQLLSSLIIWVRIAQAELVQDSIHTLIHNQALALDIAFYENPESYNLLHRARVDAISQPISLLESLGILI
ncbi:hypothetical protein CCP3SC1_310012 [Gammaproteobacteria bacterium]